MADKDIRRAISRALKMLETMEVVVGIPAEEGPRTDGAPSNAVLGYLFEGGDPETNMPPRPWLVPGVEAVRDKITKHLADGARKAIDATLKGDGDVRAGRAEAEKAKVSGANDAADRYRRVPQIHYLRDRYQARLSNVGGNS
jgi:hypothetical protein